MKKALMVAAACILPACSFLIDNAVKCDPEKCAAAVQGGKCWENVCIPTFEPIDCRVNGCEPGTECVEIGDVFQCSPPPTPPPSPSPSPSPSPTPSPSPSPTPSPSPSPTPSPVPTPTPVPGLQLDPVTGNYITDLSIQAFPWEGGVCPAEFRDSLSWVGIVFTNEVPVNCGGCVGKRYNFDATPHSVPPFCYHHTKGGTERVNRCEQARACINPAGPDFWMYNHAWAGAQPCDRHSSNPYKCHHVPRANETGTTEVCAVPQGDSPRSGRGRCVQKNVQP